MAACVPRPDRAAETFASQTLPLGSATSKVPRDGARASKECARGWGQVAWDGSEPRVTQTPLPPRGSPASDPSVVDLGFSFQGPQLGLKPDPITFQGFRPHAGREVTLTSVLKSTWPARVASPGTLPHPPSFPSLSPSDNTYKPASEPRRGFFLEMTKQIVLGACHSCEVLLKRNSV